MSLIAENVSFSYKKTTGSSNANFELKRGEIVGISGYSGCEKAPLPKFWQTICPCLGRVLIDSQPFEGQLSIGSNDLSTPRKGFES